MAKNNNHHQQQQQHLFELLKEDQEPFFLKDYIADYRKNNNNKAIINSNFKKTKNTIFQNKPSCFKSSHYYPSPSPISATNKRSPCKSPILLHIPSRTASILLEAASRIQNKPNKTHKKLNLFGSLLKRLTQKKIAIKTLIQQSDDVAVRAERNSSVDFQSRPRRSGVWSENHCSSSSSSSCCSSSERSCCYRSVDFDSELVGLCEDYCYEEEDINGFCDTQSPFRFVLQRTDSTHSGRRTPEFSSPPASSPACLHGKLLEGQEINSKGFQVDDEEEEEKEQFSPVSVLDPPFEDDYDEIHDDDDNENHDDHHDDDDEDEDQDSFDMETSFANVQRTKHQLLQKLRRFERLAELDPIELEKRMLEDENDDDEYEEGIEEDQESENYDHDCDHDCDHDNFVQEILNESSYNKLAPSHMKRLVSDLIKEERINQNRETFLIDEEITKSILKRFESWKEVRSNTIDMMVEQDFRGELRGIWKSYNKDQIGETATEVEILIFGLLVDELAQELAYV